MLYTQSWSPMRLLNLSAVQENCMSSIQEVHPLQPDSHQVILFICISSSPDSEVDIYEYFIRMKRLSIVNERVLFPQVQFPFIWKGTKTIIESLRTIWVLYKALRQLVPKIWFFTAVKVSTDQCKKDVLAKHAVIEIFAFWAKLTSKRLVQL